ncbi:MAG: putative Ig domain-containing protein [Deltaproteobacteria bacterium]|nr:putative Ig domain-containing protein [Deltaproteobacteria bacterium]
MEKKIWEERRKKKIVLPKEPESEKKDYRRWTKYIIAAVFIILLFTLLRGKKEKIEIPGPEQESGVRGQGSEKQGAGVVAQRSVSSPVVELPLPPPPKKNTPPEVLLIKLSPKIVYQGTKIKAEVSGKDADEDDEVTYFYEWRRNDTVLPDNIQPEIDTKDFKKGELITLFVTPFDGKDKGKTRFSRTIVIVNRPPEIISFPPVSVSNGKYLYEVKANDPDGDALTYSLENAPSGMIIDPATGIIRWDIPVTADLKSVTTYNIKIVVSDGDATAFQGFSMTPDVEIK